MNDFDSQPTKASKHLSEHDAILKKLIRLYGACTIKPHTNYYQELVSSIIGQQLSVKAAETIWKRFISLYDGNMPTPEQIIETNVDDIRSVGTSYSKARYIQDLAFHILNGKLDLNHIAALPNETVVEQLTAVTGIGEWSAHMFMIFSLGRLNVLPWGDLGVRKSAQMLYHLPNLPSKSELIAISEQYNWHPYESVAAWYLWQNLDNV